MAQVAISSKFLKKYIRSVNISRKKYFELLINELNMLNKDTGIQFDGNGNPIIQDDLIDLKRN